MKFKSRLFLFAFILFIYFFSVIYNKQIDKSSYTDWISAFCNLVMAGATVSAVITARNYLAQFTAQEGYKIAISLINDDLLNIKVFDSVLVAHKSLYDKIDKHKKILPMQKHVGFLKPNIITLQSEVIALDGYVNELKLKIKKLHTYGLELTKNKTIFFTSILLSCEGILSEANDLLKKAQRISDLIDENYKENKSRDYDYDRVQSGTVFELKRFESFIPNPIEVIKSKWEVLLENYELFFSEDYSITEIFKVKKAR